MIKAIMIIIRVKREIVTMMTIIMMVRKIM